jgi:hypothetical protein
MKIKILEENGFETALLGLSLNKKQNVYNMDKVAMKLGKVDGGHNKFTESITVVLDLSLPRFMWSEFDTYRIGITKQSESTMHTLENEVLTQDCFEYPIYEPYLKYLNSDLSKNRKENVVNKKTPFIAEFKNALPDGFIQRRIITTNYKTLRNIILQRQYHKLPQWKEICSYLKENLKYVDYIGVK